MVARLICGHSIDLTDTQVEILALLDVDPLCRSCRRPVPIDRGRRPAMYEYRVEVLRVVDGDTLHVRVDLGLDCAIKLTIRLLGVNAPESSTPEGQQASAYVRDWVAAAAAAGPLTLRTVKDRREKFGRYLGVISAATGGELNYELLAAGHAVAYLP